ncbi:NAD(P)/FAD-dependent oxidoreductase [Sulfobacillus harzensis]|uniref:FAD-binding oxidoreductase n=1 Tax=Sulfobacillus harzensis TaxID=2729629 RepID=A0A7Y0Q214_9FIRM|nr:FAD-dependent oxidoreductase [Sulfobacillus harzensis]NMP21421.1 FAD-binding oxidoreductase [Sulfobacillus harzensis]
MSANIIVVGGGVIGAASAYYLTQSGASVTLLDQGDIGGGTSSRCDGNVLAIDKDPGFDSQMALKSQELLHQLAQELPRFEYRRPGSYLVCDNGDEVEMAREWVRLQQEAGLPFAFLDQQAIHHHLPHLSEDVPGGLVCGSDATLNPLLYTQVLVAHARQSGAVVRPHQAVKALWIADGGVRGVQLPSGELMESDIVVVAAGIWTPSLLESAGIPIPIQPRKGHLLVSGKGPLFGDAKVMEFGYLMSKFGRERVAPAETLRYGVALVYEPTESHNFLLGSSREFVGWNTEPQVEVVGAIARRAMRFYPGMREVTIMRSYAGLRPWTPDHFPIVSRIDPISGLIVAAGHEGDGIGLAAVTGHLVADLALERDPVIPVEPLRWDRPTLKGEGVHA